MKEETYIKLTTECVKQNNILGTSISDYSDYPKELIDFNSIIASKIENYKNYKITIIIETSND